MPLMDNIILTGGVTALSIINVDINPTLSYKDLYKYISIDVSKYSNIYIATYLSPCMDTSKYTNIHISTHSSYDSYVSSSFNSHSNPIGNFENPYSDTVSSISEIVAQGSAFESKPSLKITMYGGHNLKINGENYTDKDLAKLRALGNFIKNKFSQDEPTTVAPTEWKLLGDYQKADKGVLNILMNEQGKVPDLLTTFAKVDHFINTNLFNVHKVDLTDTYLAASSEEELVSHLVPDSPTTLELTGLESSLSLEDNTL